MSSNNATARNRALWDAANANQGELELLEPAHLDALARDAGIVDALRTPELQLLIRSVDGSRCRLEALAAAEHNVPQFRQFCQQLLRCIYDAEDARHRRYRL